MLVEMYLCITAFAQSLPSKVCSLTSIGGQTIHATRSPKKNCQSTKLKQVNREYPWSICLPRHPGFLRGSSSRVGLPSSCNELTEKRNQLNLRPQGPRDRRIKQKQNPIHLSLVCMLTEHPVPNAVYLPLHFLGPSFWQQKSSAHLWCLQVYVFLAT